jgi:hypothetical protein
MLFSETINCLFAFPAIVNTNFELIYKQMQEQNHKSLTAHIYFTKQKYDFSYIKKKLGKISTRVKFQPVQGAVLHFRHPCLNA